MDEQKAAVPAWGIKAGIAVGTIGILAALSSVIIAAATAGASLLLLLVIGLVGAGVLKAIPFMGQKLENKLLSLRKGEARQNPIEQLQNFFIQKREKVNQFKSAVTQIGSQIRNLTSMLAERRRAKPNADLSRQEESLEAMKKAHSALVTKYQNAEKALVELQEVIEDRKFEWNFAKAGQQAISAMNATSGEDIINLMLADEAHASVLNNFNSVFADLEMEASKLSTANQLDYGNGITIDVSAIKLMEKVPA